MKNIILGLSMVLLLNNSAYANQKADTVPITASVEETQQVAALDENDNNEKPKKKKATKKAKKNKKVHK